MVAVVASNVALPDGARATPSDLSAPTVPASSRTDVPMPVNLGMAVTVSAWAAGVLPAFDELLDVLPQAAPARASAPHRAAADQRVRVARDMRFLFRLVRPGSGVV